MRRVSCLVWQRRGSRGRAMAGRAVLARQRGEGERERGKKEMRKKEKEKEEKEKEEERERERAGGKFGGDRDEQSRVGDRQPRDAG